MEITMKKVNEKDCEHDLVIKMPPKKQYTLECKRCKELEKILREIFENLQEILWGDTHNIVIELTLGGEKKRYDGDFISDIYWKIKEQLKRRV